MEISQKLELQLTQQQLISLQLLQMNTLDLAAYVEEQALSNPVIEPIRENDAAEGAVPSVSVISREDPFDYDVRNRYYTEQPAAASDPMDNIGHHGGLEETLSASLCLQIECSRKPEPLRSQMRYLARCLDDDGYLRIGLDELAEENGCGADEMEEALLELQQLASSPGVGARDLGECLALQLRARKADERLVALARDHLDDLAAKRYQKLSKQLGLTQDEIREAKKLLAGLQPRPGAAYAASSKTEYVVPELFVEKDGDDFVLSVRGREKRYFSLDAYYCQLLKTTEDEEVRRYLGEKLQQAELLRWRIDQRMSTLENCTRVILQRQKDFFTKGRKGLKALSLADVADELGLNISTISRAVRGKYLSYPGGVVPLSFFFVHKAGTDSADRSDMGNAAVCEVIREIVADENRKHPLSDQNICSKLAARGIRISRRTVAKYRDKMMIPAAAERREE